MSGRNEKYSKADDEKMLKLRKQGYTCEYIGRTMGMPASSVSYRTNRLERGLANEPGYTKRSENFGKEFNGVISRRWT